MFTKVEWAGRSDPPTPALRFVMQCSCGRKQCHSPFSPHYERESLLRRESIPELGWYLVNNKILDRTNVM